MSFFETACLCERVWVNQSTTLSFSAPMSYELEHRKKCILCIYIYMLIIADICSSTTILANIAPSSHTLMALSSSGMKPLQNSITSQLGAARVGLRRGTSFVGRLVLWQDR